MADIFISYASADRDRIAALVRALEDEGFSVWWDQRIEGGDIWDREIERNLESARAVLTVWTRNSMTRRWVREEAHTADNLGKLIPLQFEEAAVPIGFRLIQTENFIGWDGDFKANCWKRLVDQLQALCGQVAPGEARGRRLQASAEPAGPSIGPGAAAPLPAMLSLAAAILLLVPAIFGIPLTRIPGAVPLSAGIATALFFLLLFMQAERWLTPHTRILVSRWFLPVEGKAHVSVAEAFSGMFEAVFGRRHLSRRCLWSSALASTVAAGVVVAIVESGAGSYLLQAEKDRWWFTNNEMLIFHLFTVLVIFVPVNVIGDYFSLWETRLVLRALRRNPDLLLPLVLLDIVLTSLIFLVLIICVNFGVGIWNGWLAPDEILQRLASELDGLEGMLLAFLGGTGDNTHGGGLFFAAFLTSFITSVWLWLVLLLAPLSRLLLWARTRAAVAEWLPDPAGQPVAALGTLIAVLIVIAGTIMAAGSILFRVAMADSGDPVPAGLAREMIVEGSASDLGADCSVCPEMVVLPGGRFAMGSPEGEQGRSENESPLHQVTIRPFAMGKYEVTRDEWGLCVAEGGCRNGGPAKAGSGEEAGRKPVVDVSWHDAQDYVRWLSTRTGKAYRLPTEAEWEFAARAGTTTRFFWGNQNPVCTPGAPNGAAYKGCTAGGVLPVGSFRPNGFGLFDMHGNAWEWVTDCYHDSYDGAPHDGSPRGDWACRSMILEGARVVRGGSGFSTSRHLRSAVRARVIPGLRYEGRGFRVARTL